MIRYLLTSLGMISASTAAWTQTTLDTTAPSKVANAPDNTAKNGDGKISGLVALGLGLTPKYAGSDKYKVTPYPLIAAKWRGVELNLVGTEIKADFGGGGHFLFGPVIGLSDSRKVKDTAGPIRSLDKIGGSASFGGFVGFRFGGNERGQGRIVASLEATKDTKKDKGMTYSASVSYAAIRTKRVFATFDLSAQMNDAKYTRRFFGVTEAEAERSGLDAYRPGGGLTKISAGMTAGYQISKHWGVLSRVQGGTYTGDASDSPIVKDGAKGFGQFLMGVSYAF